LFNLELVIVVVVSTFSTFNNWIRTSDRVLEEIINHSVDIATAPKQKVCYEQSINLGKNFTDSMDFAQHFVSILYRRCWRLMLLNWLLTVDVIIVIVIVVVVAVDNPSSVSRNISHLYCFIPADVIKHRSDVYQGSHDSNREHSLEAVHLFVNGTYIIRVLGVSNIRSSNHLKG